MWIAATAIAGLAVAAALTSRLVRRSRARTVWGSAAARLGTLSMRFDEGLQTLGGVLEGIPVNVRVDGHGGSRATRIAATTDAPEGFGFEPRSPHAPVRVEVSGDPAFDAAVALSGPRVAGTAILDARARAILAEAASHGARLENGEVYLRHPGLVHDGERLASLVRVVASVARVIADAHREDRVTRLVAVATRDPEPGVRRHAIKVLIDHYRDDPAARSAFDRSMLDADAEVRMLGAAGVGPAGFEAMRSIANDASLPAPVRASALEKLLALFPRSQSVPALMKALDDRSTGARKIAITALGKLRHRAAAAPMISLSRRPIDGEEKAILAQALGRIGDPAAEPALLSLLEVDDAAVRIAVADALGRIGTAASVAPLAPHAASLLGGDLKKHATEAIARIQARLTKSGGAEGQLAMADPDSQDGWVSAPEQDGELDLVPGTAAAPRKQSS